MKSKWARLFFLDRLALLGFGVLLLIVLVAFFAPWIAPYDPVSQPDIARLRLEPPSWSFLLGTDHLSRDVFSRVIYGARVSLAVSFLAVFLSVTLGTVVGAAAGYCGGWIDSLLMRGVDLLLSLPRLVILLAVVGFWPGERSLLLITLVLGLTGWMSTSRLVRAEVLSLREREFVWAGRGLGFSSFRLIFRHILPNCLGVIVVSATLGIGSTILLEASLSYLGIGLPPPWPSWGNMVAEGASYLTTEPWIASFPGLALLLTVLSVNLVGDGLRDALGGRS